MKTLKVTLTGYRPLLMHSANMIDPDNEHVRKLGELQRQLKKLKKEDVDGREEIRRDIEKVEWLGSLYWKEDVGIYLPGDNITACIVAGARKSKSGKQAEQGLVPIDDAPITTVCKTTDLEALHKRKEFQFRSPVRIPPKTGSRLMKVRPMVPTGWTASIVIEYDIIPTSDLKEAITDAGATIGLGDWRPKFGRFSCEFGN